MAMTAAQKCEAQKIAELEVRRYMEHLFDKSLPRVIGEAVRAHDANVEAHSSLFKRQVSTVKLVAAAFVAGAGGGGIIKLLGVL